MRTPLRVPAWTRAFAAPTTPAAKASKPHRPPSERFRQKRGDRPERGAQRPDASHPRRSQQRSHVPSSKNWTRQAPPAQAARTQPSGGEQKRPTNKGSSSREVYLPSLVSVFNLARILAVNMRVLQFRMEKIGFTDVRPDHLLKFEDAELLAAEFNVVAVANEEAAFDIFPRPPVPEEQQSSLPLRPPVVTIMGHVDHGKTTLLDRLRSSSVAQGEAGGITQHIGAFSVPVRAAQRRADAGAEHVDTVTFLDTPGHAAFSMMRSRGASVTDIVVLVVAADDSVMPQTQEVISLVQGDGGTSSGVQLVVAISKVDKPAADPQRVRYDLLSAGIEVEDLGGEVPCVEISATKGTGLDELEETLATLAELVELRAEHTGPAEGRVLESHIDRGRGNVATVLVQRGTLRPGDFLVAGTAWARVRQLLQADGAPAKQVLPGNAAQVAGWRELPAAGDEFLGAPGEAQCKRAVTNRKLAQERRALLNDADQIDQNRRRKAEEDARRERAEQDERQQQRELARRQDEGLLDEAALAELAAARRAAEEAGAEQAAPERLELRLLLKGDYSGTVEALAGALQGIGNPKAGVRIVSQGVGEPTESDVNTAHAVGGHVVGFNVKASRAVQGTASRLQPRVNLHCDNVIYRIMEYVTQQVAALLPPVQELRVQGEAQVAQLFQIKTGSRAARSIAGCRVTNGVISRANEVRVLRGPERTEVFRGRLDALRQVKKDVSEMRKGTECGMSFAGFDGIQEGDIVQSFTVVDVPQSL